MRRPPGYRRFRVRCDVHVDVDAGSLDEAAMLAMVVACGGRWRWWHRWTKRRRARRPWQVVGSGYLGADVLDRRGRWRHVDGAEMHERLVPEAAHRRPVVHKDFCGLYGEECRC